MQYPNMYGGPQIPPQPNKSNRVIFIVAGVAFVVIALAVVGGVFAFRAAQRTASAATSTGDSFLNAIAAHQYKTAAVLCDPSQAANFSPQNLSDIESLLEKRHGRMQNHGMAQWFVQSNNGLTSVNLTYNTQFSNGVIPMTVTVMQTPSGYRVAGWHYQLQ